MWVSIRIYFIFHIFIYLFCCLPNKLYIIIIIIYTCVSYDNKRASRDTHTQILQYIVDAEAMVSDKSHVTYSMIYLREQWFSLDDNEMKDYFIGELDKKSWWREIIAQLYRVYYSTIVGIL